MTEQQPEQEERRGKGSTMAEAFSRYRKSWGSRAEPGMLRDRVVNGRIEFYYLPRWVDNWQFLAGHLVLRVRGRCISCRMRGGHKFDCSRSWRIRDDLLNLVPRFHSWLVSRSEKKAGEGG